MCFLIFATTGPDVDCRAEDKLAALLWLLRETVDHEQQQSIVFASTRHHVELLFSLLAAEGLSCACVYGAMDQVAPCQSPSTPIHEEHHLALHEQDLSSTHQTGVVL